MPVVRFVYGEGNKVFCLDDKREERCGFLWLKKRKVKDPRITEGKKYKLIGIYSAKYDFMDPIEFYLIYDDSGVRQYLEAERFVEVLE